MQDYAKIQQALLLDLSAELRNDSGFISSDMSLDEVRAHALSHSFYKKLSPNGDSKVADEAALKKFLLINATTPTTFEFGVRSEYDSLLWDYFRNNVAKALDFDVGDVNFDLEFMRSTFNIGPGSSIGANSESFYTKLFESCISSTSPYLVALYRAAIHGTDFWSSAEKQASIKFGYQIVEGNRLFFVPKNVDISRTCCTEPLLNMLFQKSLGSFLEVRLAKHFGINLSTQPDYNKELARIGSIDGSFGTIDLASASDSINWDLCKQIIPSNLLGFFSNFRSPSATLPGGEVIPLKMISTMGNGFTFPLQTILFASAVRTVYQLMGKPSADPRTQFGVFGDDIIVSRDAYDSVVYLLTKLGFEVNESKSFNSGPFRESCGSDWYSGHSVRGIYIRSLETLSECMSAVNRLNRWSAESGIYIPTTIASILEKFGSLPRLPHIPWSESDDAGYKVPFDLTVPRVLDNYWFAYRKLVKSTKRRAVPIDDQSSSILFYRDFNSHGWAVAFGLGYVSPPKRLIDGSETLEELATYDPVHYITVRGDRIVLKEKCVRASIPFWDYAPTRAVELRRGSLLMQGSTRASSTSYGDWKVAVAANSSFCLS